MAGAPPMKGGGKGDGKGAGQGAEDGDRRRRPALLLLKLGVSLAVTLALCESALQLNPAWIPAPYRESFPLHGVEFFDSEILDRTPITSVPLPLMVAELDGPPPSDLAPFGMMPADEDTDRERYPRVRVRVDSNGLPNAREYDTADVVLVGDSFLVSAGMTEPNGLVARLAERTGLDCYNLGVSGIGPFRKRFLMEELGLPKNPKLVIWFFFGGNDTVDALAVLRHRKHGKKTYGEVYADRRTPRLVLPGLLRFLFARKAPGPPSDPQPGLPLAANPEARVWFNPNYLLFLTKTREEWGRDPGWRAVQAELIEAFETASADTDFLAVYLPSKAQAYLPYVEQDAEAIHRMVHVGRTMEIGMEPDEFLEKALAHRGDLEQLFIEFCRRQGIPHLSATTLFEDMAREGKEAYLTSDTHWSDVGQGALVEPIADWLEQLGVVPRSD